jgi:hypothetical protein
MAPGGNNFKHEISSLKLFRSASMMLAPDAHLWPIPPGNEEQAQ